MCEHSIYKSMIEDNHFIRFVLQPFCMIVEKNSDLLGYFPARCPLLDNAMVQQQRRIYTSTRVIDY